MIHLQGMGLLGSLTAWQLHRFGVPFTWDDTEEGINAWRACTGACYPASSEVDRLCFDLWRQWAGVYPKGSLETCSYWVDSVHKALPHGLKSRVLSTAGSMRLVGHSHHCNAQLLVKETRATFAKQRRDGGNPTVVAHGFSAMRSRYLWGWTRLIRLDVPRSILKYGRPSFYLRKSRFLFAYCYPVPHTPWYYAGSSLISQQVAKDLAPEPKYERWKRAFAELCGGQVQVAEEGGFLTGWRPARAGKLSALEGADAGGDGLQEIDGVIYYPSLASGGFRRFPYVWSQLVEGLKRKSPGLTRGLEAASEEIRASQSPYAPSA